MIQIIKKPIQDDFFAILNLLIYAIFMMHNNSKIDRKY